MVIAAEAAASKKADDTVALDVSTISGITDAFVITSASNTRLVRTIAEEIERRLKERTSIAPRSVEGLDDLTWVCMDYGDLVVHVFLSETRDYYQLERLWADAAPIDWEKPAAAVS